MTLIYFFRVDGVEEIQYEISRIKQRSKSQFPELSLSILNCAFRPNCMFPAMLDLSMSSKSNPSIHPSIFQIHTPFSKGTVDPVRSPS